MAAYLVLDSASSGVPILGWAFDTFFRGHAMAAGALQKDIEARHGPPRPQPIWDQTPAAPAATRPMASTNRPIEAQRTRLSRRRRASSVGPPPDAGRRRPDTAPRVEVFGAEGRLGGRGARSLLALVIPVIF
jgi:hypothetical protein